MAKTKKRDLARDRYEATLERIEAWEKRERRAVNMLRKLRDTKTRYETRRPDLIRTVLLANLRQSSKVAKPGQNGTAHA